MLWLWFISINWVPFHINLLPPAFWKLSYFTKTSEGYWGTEPQSRVHHLLPSKQTHPYTFHLLCLPQLLFWSNWKIPPFLLKQEFCTCQFPQSLIMCQSPTSKINCTVSKTEKWGRIQRSLEKKKKMRGELLLNPLAFDYKTAHPVFSLQSSPSQTFSPHKWL